MSTLVFVHVAKAAGTSTVACLKRLVAPGTTRPIYEAVPESYEGASLVSSHANFVDLERVSGKKFFVTTLRSPTGRLLSIYRYWQSIKIEEAVLNGYTHVIETKRLSLDEFLMSDSPLLAQNLDNEMTRQFCSAIGKLTESDFDLAVENLRKCCAIFRAENLDDDILHFFTQIGCSNRFQPSAANVTSENHKNNPKFFEPAKSVDLSALSPAAYEALLEKTAFDQRLYKIGMSLAAGKRNEPIRDLGDFPIYRAKIARGETIVPNTSEDFASLLGHGWGPLDSILWSTSPIATLKFRVKGGTASPTGVILRINGCLIGNRNYVVSEIIVDDQEKKTAVFLANDCVIRASCLKEFDVDVICTSNKVSAIEFALAPDPDENRIHTIQIRSSGAASPAFLGLNHDDRTLGVSFGSLEIF